MQIYIKFQPINLSASRQNRSWDNRDASKNLLFFPPLLLSAVHLATCLPAFCCSPGYLSTCFLPFTWIPAFCCSPGYLSTCFLPFTWIPAFCCCPGYLSTCLLLFPWLPVCLPSAVHQFTVCSPGNLSVHLSTVCLPGYHTCLLLFHMLPVYPPFAVHLATIYGLFTCWPVYCLSTSSTCLPVQLIKLSTCSNCPPHLPVYLCPSSPCPPYLPVSLPYLSTLSVCLPHSLVYQMLHLTTIGKSSVLVDTMCISIQQ